MTLQKKPKCILVDGSSYLFRAYHALPPLTNSKGVPTGAVYGVSNMLKKLLADEKADYVAVIFDTKSKNFRHALYPAYKANRPEMPDELRVQIEPLHALIRAMGFPLIAMEGYEADDIIGTFAQQAVQKGIETLISTGDKDFAQCVDSHITLVNTMSGSVLNEATVKEKFGVNPDQIVDYLALMGDAVDNVPGVPNVGPKTAAKWLNQYGSLDNLIAHADDIKGKVGENLRQHLPELPLAKQLVTIRHDVPTQMSVTDLVVQPRDVAALRELFTTLEFKSWLRELDKDSGTEGAASSTLSHGDQSTHSHDAHPSPSSQHHEKGTYTTVLTESQLSEWIGLIQQHQQVVIDTETTSLDPLAAQLVGISLAVEPLSAVYIPLTHDYIDCPPLLPKNTVLERLKPLLTDPTIGKTGQHIKYDMHILMGEGIYLQGVTDDTMLASYALNSTSTRHDMDSLSKHYLHYDTIPYEAVAGKGAKQITFNQVPLDVATQYAAEDADITLRLKNVLLERLSTEPSLMSVYRDIEMPLVDVLFRMEQTGVCIDAELLHQQSEEITKTLTELEEQAYILAGETFNLNSPKQLQAIFFEKLNMPIIERTPTGVPSTAESVLQELSEEFELPRLLLTHRTLSKLKSTYTDKLPGQINPKTGRVHTSYHQAGTATGRLSSSDPNLQNIPVRTPEGRRIRQAFIAPKGFKIVSADYSQIELRIMAHLSQDPGLLHAFRDNQDIHRFTASQVWHTPLEAVTPEQRRNAKAINFGLIYGMSAFGLSKQLDVSPKEAQLYMDQYFERYPGVKTYMETIRHKAEQQGYVETLLGRRLYLPEIRAKNVGRKRAAERAAINAPMQGTAADMIKLAMITIDGKIRDNDAIHMIMQVHDELVFEIREDFLEAGKALIVDGMQNALPLSVPLIVGIGVGDNWDAAH